jgi:hypothetical protein
MLAREGEKMNNLVVRDGDTRLVFYPEGGFSHEFLCPMGFWSPCDPDEPIESKHLREAVRLWRPNYPLEDGASNG